MHRFDDVVSISQDPGHSASPSSDSTWRRGGSETAPSGPKEATGCTIGAFPGTQLEGPASMQRYLCHGHAYLRH